MPGALHSGHSISHYRVISPLGAGGMGEVYVAQDENLERAVALKILPPDLMKNEDRVRRFIQEAKSASSLSHPHIVTIYEIGNAPVRGGDGEGSGTGSDRTGAGAAAPADSLPIHFIAMELITGETLKQKIHHDREDLRTLLRYMAQVAEGLAKAHSAGIVHRDLKPDNIMISKDGYAKVLDFGLAKLTERREANEEVTSLPTATEHNTRAGAVVGTANYMAPEQVKGKTVDHRADIFAFGSILYEAATRRRPFAAETEVESMHRILHDTPTPVEELNPQVPNALRRIIRRCLAKSPEQRLHSMKDLALELNDLVEEFDQLATSGSSGVSVPSGSSPAVAAQGRWPTGTRIAIAAAVLVGLAGLVIGIQGLRQRSLPVAEGTASFQTMRMTRLTSSGDARSGTISPDGRYVAHAMNEQGGNSLWIRQVATGSDVRVVEPLPTPFLGISFSPDGNYLYYVNSETTSGTGYSALYQVPVLGGTTRKLLFDIDSAVSFSPDGDEIAFTRGYPEQSSVALMIAGADGKGERRLAIRQEPEAFSTQPAPWSPDGARLAAVAFGAEGEGRNKVVTVDVADGTERALGTTRWFSINGLAWLADGSGLVLAASDKQGDFTRQIWSLSYPGGVARRISNDLNDYSGVSITADSATIATTRIDQISNLFIEPFAGDGEARQLTFGSGNDDAVIFPDVSPDRSVVFGRRYNGVPQLFEVSFDGGEPIRLTSGPDPRGFPSVSGDGRLIAHMAASGDQKPHIWIMDGDGGNLRQITEGREGENAPEFSPDGRWLVHRSFGDRNLYRVSLEDGSSQILAADADGEAIISPDGRSIAYDTFTSDDGISTRMLRIIPATGGAPTHSLPFDDPIGVRWSLSGKAITGLRNIDGRWNIWEYPLDGNPPRQITDFEGDRVFGYDWSADGRDLILKRGKVIRDIVLISDFR
jgi:serine/threonine protein kinase/WD40 repeat protein